MLYIIIPVHNKKEFTKNCLLSLKEQTYSDFRIVVVDDGSIDGTREMLLTEFPEVKIIEGDGNLWWTGAINKGLEYVFYEADTTDFVMTLNNDLVVNSNYLEKIVSIAIENTNSIIGSLCVEISDKQSILDGGVKVNIRTAKYLSLDQDKKLNDLIDSEKVIEVDLLSGRGTLIPFYIFHKIGVYNREKLPHYGADYEYSFRAKKRKIKLLLSREAIVFSHSSNTGINNRNKKIKWAELFQSFFSIRSPYNLKYRWNYAVLTCSMKYLPIYYTLDITRVFLGVIKNQLFSREYFKSLILSFLII